MDIPFLLLDTIILSNRNRVYFQQKWSLVEYSSAEGTCVCCIKERYVSPGTYIRGELEGGGEWCNYKVLKLYTFFTQLPDTFSLFITSRDPQSGSHLAFTGYKHYMLYQSSCIPISRTRDLEQRRSQTGLLIGALILRNSDTFFYQNIPNVVSLREHIHH